MYIDKKLYSRLADGFEELVPTTAFVDAVGSSRVGDALRILVPHLFSPEDLKLPSIKDLTGTKVSALFAFREDKNFATRIQHIIIINLKTSRPE